MRFIVFLLVTIISLAASASLAQTEIELESGEVLKGEILEEGDQTIQVNHPVLGPLSIPAKKIQAIRIPSPPSDWQRRVEMGLSGTEGNSQTLDLRLAALGEQRTSEKRWKLDAVYWFSKSDGTTQEEEFSASARREWLFTQSPWFSFAQGRGLYDRFEDWNIRINANGGIGYQHLQRPTLRIQSSYGLGAYREFGGEDNDIHPELVLGGELGWEVWGQQISAEASLFPDLKETGEYRLLGRAEWIVGLQGMKNLQLSLGIEDEYQSETEGDVEHNDLKYYASLTYPF